MSAIGDTQDSGTSPQATSTSRFVAGDKIDARYRLVRLLGRGGMGEVWEAHHASLDRPVALKLVRIDTDESRAQLLREARLLASLHHPAIVAIHDAGVTTEGVAYLAMDVLAGESLALRIARGRLDVPVGVALFVELLEGLEAAHVIGIVHRDIKPDNVLLVERDHHVAPTLVDFGIAVPASGGSGAPERAGTPQYMAPEQLRGLACDERTDVWASCVSLYEAITGRAPFIGHDDATMAENIFATPLAFPTDVPALDGKLWSILTGGLRKDPADRIPSARDLRVALVAWLARGPRPPAPVTLPPPSPPSRPAPYPLEALIRQKLSGG